MKKRIICAFLAILTLFTVICIATENTEELEATPYTIPEEYRRDDIMLISEEYTETEYIDGDKLIAEDETTTVSEQNVNGNVFAMVTPMITIENTTIDGNLFIMANIIELKNVHVTGSIFAMAEEITTSGLYVNDIYFLGNNISLQGSISREAKMFGEKVTIDCQINGKSYIYGSDIRINDNAALYDTANIEYSDSYTQSENAICEDIKTTQVENIEEETYDRNEQIKSEITQWIIEIVKTVIVVGFVILFTDRKFERFASKLYTKNYIGLTLKGFAWLILIPIAAIMLIIISRAYLFGFPILALVIYFILAYLSLQIVSIAIGSTIKNKKMPDKGNIEYTGITLLTMTVLWLLGKLPVIGTIVWFIVVMLSLGIMMKYIFNSKEKNKEEPVVVETNEEK